MVHRAFIWRQISRSKGQSLLFVICTALSIAIITAVNGLKDSVEQVILKDARTLHAADIIVHSHTPLSPLLLQTVSRFSAEGRIQSARVFEFYSVVRTIENHRSLLSKLKIATMGYPFYGRVELGSGRSFAQVLTAGKVIAEPLLLKRLNLRIGDRLRVGDISLTIADTVIGEPDRPLSVFSLGPRLFVHSDDLNALNLLGKSSRSHYNYLIKVLQPDQLSGITEEIRAAADPNTEQVDTYQTARSGVKRATDNFLFFLSLTAIFCLIMAGFGIQSTLIAFINAKKTTIGIMKTLGASYRFIILNYSLAVVFLGLIGTTLGILTGLTTQRLLPYLLSELLPSGLVPVISISGLLQSLFLGAMGVMIFSFPPLVRLKEIRPTTIFRKEAIVHLPKWTEIGVIFIGTMFFTAMVLWYLGDRKIGFYFLMLAVGLIAVTYLMTQLFLILLKRLPSPRLSLRQAIKGLYRPQNRTALTIMTLSASFAVIMTLLLLERNISANYVNTYPEDAPNLYFLDIQPNQVTTFKKELARPARFYPVIRARITAINQIPIDHRAEKRKRGDNLGREFNLTHRSDLLPDEALISGQTLFRSDWTEPQVSIMDTVIDMHPVAIGDRIEFNVQGIPVVARISSIRHRSQGNLSPFFYFVFQPETLQRAPQTIFTALSIPPEDMAPLQNKIVTAFPNVSVIDVSATIKQFSKVLYQLVRVVHFFTLFSCAAGLLIFISALLATRSARIREAVYYKILGAGKAFVLQVLTWENLIIGTISALFAVTIAQAASYMICQYLFEVNYQLFMGTTLITKGLILTVILVIGHLAARPILFQKPVTFLRENNVE